MAETPPIAPVWIRLPAAKETCPYSGLTRSALNELILCQPPLVRTCSLKEEGESRGIRLIDRQSLMEYLDSKAEGPEPKKVPQIPTIGNPNWTAKNYVNCGRYFAQGFADELRSILSKSPEFASLLAMVQGNSSVAQPSSQ